MLSAEEKKGGIREKNPEGGNAERPDQRRREVLSENYRRMKKEKRLRKSGLREKTGDQRITGGLVRQKGPKKNEKLLEGVACRGNLVCPHLDGSHKGRRY